MTTVDFAAVDPETWVALLPVAATEQHGPHLPVSVDAAINAGIIDRTVPLLPDDLPVVVLPQQVIGKSNEHVDFPGTLTFSAETLIRIWTEIGESVARAGFRKLVLFNSHGGQPQIADIVARDLRARLGMLVVTAHSYALGMPPGLSFSETELRFGIHGGSIETSMMLHLRPESVRQDRRADFRSAAIDLERDYPHLRAEGAVGMGWLIQDLNPAGACGDATDADAERGRQLVEHVAAKLAALLRDVSAYPMARLKSRI